LNRAVDPSGKPSAVPAKTVRNTGLFKGARGRRIIKWIASLKNRRLPRGNRGFSRPGERGGFTDREEKEEDFAKNQLLIQKFIQKVKILCYVLPICDD